VSGQSLVEFTLIVPVMLILLLTALDLGRLMYAQITVTNAAKEGALVASQGGSFKANADCADDNTIMCGVLTEAKGGFVEVDKTKVSVAPALCVKDATYPSSGAPPNVSVTVKTPFRVITPLIGDFLGSSVILTGIADAQCLVVPKVTFPSLPSPTALFTATPQSGPAPLTVSFDASASSSPGATITSYSWSFGASGVNVSNKFNTAGTYVVKLTVTDSRGQTSSQSQNVTVLPPGCPTVSFIATDRSNGGHPHRMDLAGSVSDSSSGWTWAWTGAITGSGQNLNNKDFPKSGPQSVTLTATKGSCSPTITQIINAP